MSQCVRVCVYMCVSEIEVHTKCPTLEESQERQKEKINDDFNKGDSATVQTVFTQNQRESKTRSQSQETKRIDLA